MRISKKILLLSAMAALAVPGAFAQQSMKVSGSVVDGDGQPLPGAYVIAYSDASSQKAKENVMVDIDGCYTISALPTDVLEFSFIGYNSETAQVAFCVMPRLYFLLFPRVLGILAEN